MSEPGTTPTAVGSKKRRLLIFLIFVAIVGAAIARSNITTSLDTYNLDEAYHIGAGVSYVETGDYRLNPEHPPLIKLWVGAWQSLNGFALSPIRPLNDKFDERFFVEEYVYNSNDPDLVLANARAAMFTLNGLLLLLFGVTVRHVFGDVMALGSMSFLAIDPTVAAHLPVVMTDLPVALTSATAVILSVNAFRTLRISDMLLAAIALGLALSSKHSALIVAFAIGIIGLAWLLYSLRSSRRTEVLFRAGGLLGIGAVSLAILWGTYSFRYYESPGSYEDSFNRPLADKILDVKSPLYRSGLTFMRDSYLFPRAYTWGLADTIRAGAEGRVRSAYAFGQIYYGSAPWFYAFGIIFVKVPLGLLLLSIFGIGFLIARLVPGDLIPAIIGYALYAAIYFFFIINGSTYGGIRHLLPIIPLLGILASITLLVAVHYRSRLIGSGIVLATIAAIVSAVPVMRPWEYFNETVGGTSNGYKYFDDESVDIHQRGADAVRYYREVLEPAGEIPYVFYVLPDIKDPAKTLDQVSSRKERDRGKWDGPTATGTFIVGANSIAPSLWWDRAAFREAEPIARFGNLFVFRGTFDIQPMRAQGLYHFGKVALYGPEADVERGIRMLEESVRLDPRAFFVAIELGSQYIRIGRWDDARKAYESALAYTPDGEPTRELLEQQIQFLRTGEYEKIVPLRDPSSE